MPSRRHQFQFLRRTQFESLESRVVFSGDSATALFLQTELDLPEPLADSAMAYSLADAHQSTGVEFVFQDYGFDGSGQTIAVIDSGIAWDHYALGGGLGESYRVVGGWDFAEGDADPFDDGGAGYHGTHVAGIIGSHDAQHRGVAPGADLVGLRVFDDNGRGDLTWVEQALQWVHDHKDAFANPITTVNLSLGIDGNANSLPGWAMLEDEFAQLRADNIFISVAAGNAFQNYGTPGVAYPAVSNHVVPVASHGSDGFFSDFSQRNDRVLVAPGESITSTVPGHLFGQGPSHQFLAASGTSMAAPYVAGASAILRQAMEFAGYERINQEMLYQHFRTTATPFFDSVTGSVYHRLDLGAAVQSVIQDPHGQDAATATDLGTLQGGEILQGTIGRLSDVDAFLFRAGHTGQLNMQLAPHSGWQAALTINGQSVFMHQGLATWNVVAGQDYVLSISTLGGTGHYDLDLEIQPTPAALDLGSVDARSLEHQVVAGESWYRLTASRSGILTAVIDQSSLGLAVYDASMNLVSQGDAAASPMRTDLPVQAGQTCFIKVSGHALDFGLQLRNQVSLREGVLSIAGTQADEAFTLNHTADGRLLIDLVQTRYVFSANELQWLMLDGAGGNDQLHLNLAGIGDELYVMPHAVQATTSQFFLSGSNLETIFAAVDASDSVFLLDSPGNDLFTVQELESALHSDAFSAHVSGASRLQVVSRSGFDSLIIDGSQGADRFTVSQNHVRWNDADREVLGIGFDDIRLRAGSGIDTIAIHGGNGTDHFQMHGNRTNASLSGMTLRAEGFENTLVVATDSSDTVTLKGTEGDDQLYSSHESTQLRGEGYQNTALGAYQIVVDVSDDAGNDTAWASDSVGDDQLNGDHHHIQISALGRDRQFYGFDRVTVVAEHGGLDQAWFEGTRGRDTLFAAGNQVHVWGARYHIGMLGFDQLAVNGHGGNNSTLLRGDAGNTDFLVTGTSTRMADAGHRVTVTDFQHQVLDGGGGQNSVVMREFREHDQLTARDTGLLAFLNGARIQAENFIWLEAETAEGHSSSKEMEAVDFWFALHGDWRESD